MIAVVLSLGGGDGRILDDLNALFLLGSLFAQGDLLLANDHIALILRRLRVVTLGSTTAVRRIFFSLLIGNGRLIDGRIEMVSDERV